MIFDPNRYIPPTVPGQGWPRTEMCGDVMHLDRGIPVICGVITTKAAPNAVCLACRIRRQQASRARRKLVLEKRKRAV